MPVDLSDLVDSLRREVNTPGADSFPDANNSVYVGYLQDGFWEIRLDGISSFDGYTEAEGIVSPVDSSGDVDPDGTDLDRTLQQLIVLYAGVRMIRNQLLNLQSVFRAKAGPVEYETQYSASLLKAVLDELRARRDLILYRLANVGAVTDYYIDALSAREASFDSGYTHWWTS